MCFAVAVGVGKQFLRERILCRAGGPSYRYHGAATYMWSVDNKAKKNCELTKTTITSTAILAIF